MPVSVRAGERPEQRAGGVLGGALFAALLFGAAQLVPPYASLAAAAVSPFPIALQRLRSGLGGGLGALVVAAALLSAVFQAGVGLSFTIVFGVPGLLMGHAMARGRGLLRGCAWAFAFLALVVGVGLLVAGPDMAKPMLEACRAMRSPESLKQLSASLPSEQVELWTERSEMLEASLAIVYPAAFIIMAAALVLVNALLMRLYLLRRDPAWLEDGEFESIRLPFGLSVVFVLSGAAVLVPALRAPAYNALLLVGFFFALQGLAVVAFYAHRLAAPPFLRLAVLLLVLINPWAPQILGLLGLFDMWFDFRKWAEPPTETK